MAFTGFEFKQFEKYVKQIGIANEQFELFLKQFLLEQALRVVKQAKLLTPVDTGALRNSWAIGNQEVRLMETGELTAGGREKVAIDPNKSDIESIAIIDNTLYVTIFNPIEYAAPVEYGHGSYQGKFMLTISIDNVQSALPSRFHKQFEQFCKNGGLI